MKVTLLGPHPESDNFSIINYFNFYRTNLASALPGWQVDGKWPGPRQAAYMPVRDRNMSKTRWENFVRWPAQLAMVNSDVVHIVDQGLAWYCRFTRAGRKLITIHDLISYMKWKQMLPLGATSARSKVHMAECARQIQRADHLVSVSSTTADHLRSILHIPSCKITVIPNVLEPSFSPLSDEQRVAARARWFGDAEYVVIHVGKASYYKNRIGALRAFDGVHRQLPGAQMFLVHGAPSGPESLFLKECNSRSAIHFLQPMTREDLREFYGAADALVFPSLYEGFGWPPLEAMACGCPVVCSGRGSLREVAGEAAVILDDPHDHKSFAETLIRILCDGTTAKELRERGYARVKQFSPARLLPCMADVYNGLY